MPEPFINVFPKGKYVECQTLTLVKLNQKIKDVHNEIVARSDSSIQLLISEVRTRIHSLFKISESIALLDLLASFAHTSTTNAYKRPELTTDILAIKAARHPILEVIQKNEYIPNDVYATQADRRFQVVTGCNMSGKSCYIRSIALQTILAQIGSFVPAEHGLFPIRHSLFARISTDNYIEANISTFASEMREMSFILRNVEPSSLVIVDELGRGTSTTDGLSIAIAISEALIQSKAHVWFVTHFRDLARILAERVGVFNLHMHVDISQDFSTMKMRYRISEGHESQKYYGLALAQLVDLPDEVMEVAVAVSQRLNARGEEKKGNAKTIALAKRRKLTVRLKEILLQARDGDLQGQELLEKMKKVQEEFYIRLAAIEAEYLAAAADEAGTNGTKTKMASASPIPRAAGTADPESKVELEEQNGEIQKDAIITPRSYQDVMKSTTMPFKRRSTPLEQHQRAISSSLAEQPQTPGLPLNASKDALKPYDNPIFRAMPTDFPSSMRINKEGNAHHSINIVKEDIQADMLDQKGDRPDSPIYIEDDGMSVSEEFYY